MWVPYNPNPTGRNVEDCSVRAITKALEVSWSEAYALTTSRGFAMCDMPHSNSVWGSVLKENGFYRESLPTSCPDCFSAEDFCIEHPNGIYVLGFGRHVATVVDGDIYDSWNSSTEVPQYYWKKEDS